MADVTVTAADVRPLPGAKTRRFALGGAVNPGQAVYIAADGDIEGADADVAAQSRVVGILVSLAHGGLTGAAGDVGDVVVHGPVAGFSGLTPGGLVFASVNAGAIADAAPAAASGDFVWVIGHVEKATTVFVNPFTYSVTAQ
jgi:hypothetical protein